MRALRSLTCLTLSLSLALGAVPSVRAASASVEVRVGANKDQSHVEFHGAQPKTARRDGHDLVLHFGAIGQPDISRLRVDPPQFVKTAALEPVAGGVDLRISLTDDADVKLGRADGAAYVNIFAAVKADTGPPKADQTPQDRPNPTPASGVVKMQPELQGRNLLLRFPWAAPLGAAVFRRGEAIWIVFDAKAKLDLSQAPHGLAQMKRMDAVPGDNVTALRIVAPDATLATASATGGTWTIALGSAAPASPGDVPVTVDRNNGPPALSAQMAGSTGVFWLRDPAVGDRLAVVTALPPAKGLPERRTFVQATLLASTLGLAIDPAVDDLAVTTTGDTVRIARPQGLTLSSESVALKAIAAPIDLPAAASLPALVDYDNWSKTGPKGFLARYDQLLAAASDEVAKGKAGGVQARLGLARFLIGSELSFEAIGVLNMIASTNQTLMSDPEFRGLRGAARAMAGRYKDAQADFSSPVLNDDPASALWRGYIASRLGDFAGARDQFAAGKTALAQFAPKWRARFARAEAEAALDAGDLGTARNRLLLAGSLPLDLIETQAVRLDQARLMEASGQKAEALPIYDTISKSTYGALAAPALLHAVQIKLDTGQMQPPDAVAALDSIRFRWRGDATELDTIRLLAKIYMSQGRLREALEALRSAGRRLPDLPAAVQLQADLAGAFRALFLNGGADGLQPIQALALFYDFKELTPVGAEGDLMVRKLSHRLVDVDLLDQAAELLKYQADSRLDGVPRAEVDTDLATIQLMNRKPEAALDALNNSRSTLLPNTLNSERRVIEARALVDLGRFDHAIEILGKDTSPEANAVRAELAWKQHSWTSAGSLLEAQLGDRWKSALPLNSDEETRLLRAGVAYSLSDDQASLARLRTRYGKLAEGGRTPDALRVALSGADSPTASAADFARAASDADAFAGWVQRMKKKFQEKPAPLAAPAAKPVQQAAAPKAGAAKTGA